MKMIIKTYTDGRLAEVVVNNSKNVPDAMDLVRVLIANSASAAKIIKSKPGWRRPGIQVARHEENYK